MKRAGGIARTIADLAGADRVTEEHVAQSIRSRGAERGVSVTSCIERWWSRADDGSLYFDCGVWRIPLEGSRRRRCERRDQ